MAHWSDQYVGKPYVKDSLDCSGWVERIEREQFGRDVRLPSERAQGLRPRSRQIETERDRFVIRTHAPQEGDVVMMRSRGDLWHVGLFCLIAREPWVLHAMEGFGSIARHRVRSLADLGLEFEGYYKWI